jgi:hypothetical protein
VPRSTELRKKQNATSTPECQAGVLVVRRHHIGPFNFEKGCSRLNDVAGEVL